jgi:hypothetical protein
MRLIYLAARLYPYWAIALSMAFIQVGLYYRRLGNAKQWHFFGLTGILLVGLLVWLIFRGDRNSDLWLRSLGLTY